MKIRLVPIEKWPGRYKLRWQLMKYRPEERCISHRAMPDWDDHCAFVDDPPYLAWYVVAVDGQPAGTVYLTHPAGQSLAGDEIGLDLFPRFIDEAVVGSVVDELMELHPRKRYLWNVATLDDEMKRIVQQLGFWIVQETYEWREGGLDE